jgi:hypothetical protein
VPQGDAFELDAAVGDVDHGPGLDKATTAASEDEASEEAGARGWGFPSAAAWAADGDAWEDLIEHGTEVDCRSLHVPEGAWVGVRAVHDAYGEARRGARCPW